MKIAILILLAALNLPANTDTIYTVNAGSYKCYMDYRCITDQSSPQWQLQPKAHTDQNGLRKVGDRYCIALGSAYGSDIGQHYTLVLSTGREIKAILADQKADCHTNAANTMDKNGAVAEFIVETNKLPKVVRQMGDVSYCKGFGGKIVRIEREEKVK